MIRIYVASSWRNTRQPEVVEALRKAGFGVYDFRHPAPGESGFHWSEIDPAWRDWTPTAFRDALAHPIALAGFNRDREALDGCDAGVLVLPSGRSAHLEAGYLIGQSKSVFVLLAPDEPELMYLLSARLATSLPDLLAMMQELIVPALR